MVSPGDLQIFRMALENRARQYSQAWPGSRKTDEAMVIRLRPAVVSPGRANAPVQIHVAGGAFIPPGLLQQADISGNQFYPCKARVGLIFIQ